MRTRTKLQADVECEAVVEKVNINPETPTGCPDGRVKPLAENRLYYGVEDSPPWPTAILFGFQQVMVGIGSVVSVPLVLCGMICARENFFARVSLIGTTMFTVGLSTILQSTIGVRLPLLQGPSASFLPPVVALMKLPEFQCSRSANSTNISDPDAEWMSRITTVQGGLIAASLFQMFLGITGLVGFVTSFIGPLTIAPLMLCLSLSLIDLILSYAATHTMSLVMISLILLFGFYLAEINVSLPSYHFAMKRWRRIRFPLFSLFPYMLALSIAWILCAILTYSCVFSAESDVPARTDRHSQWIADAPVFRFPYPGQWGTPRFNLAVFLGMTIGTIGSVIDSIGDYHACARVCWQPPPKAHAVNRGIFIEGLCCFVGGFLGGGTSVTTYGENIGVIGITKVASRRTMQIAGVMLIVLGLFTKVGAVLSSIPDPLIGGILLVSLSMVGAVGISSVHLMDLHSTRNVAILGLAIMLGLAVPKWIDKVPLKTGSAAFDQFLTIILSTSMIVGGGVGFMLDNTVPGATRAQRGFHTSELKRTLVDQREVGTSDPDVYDFPPPFGRWIRRIPLGRWIPIAPMFVPFKLKMQKRHLAKKPPPETHLLSENVLQNSV